MDATVNAAQSPTVSPESPGLREALLRSPTVPPVADATAPAMANAARFVGVLLVCATAVAWLVLPIVM